MAKNTAEVQGYFKRHTGANELYFVKGMPFFKEEDALAQAANLHRHNGIEWPVEKVERGSLSPTLPEGEEGEAAAEQPAEGTGSADVTKPGKRTRKQI